MRRHVIVAKFYIESDQDPQDLGIDFERGLSTFGGPILQAAQGFPSGDVLSGDVETVREPTEEEVNLHFEE